jgi:hypothetical protein
MAVDPFGFTQSQAARGYSPQFLNTGTEAETPMAGAQSPDLTNRLLQILSGQLGGTLTGGEKLSALGALLKSVSRGSQTSPQQVLQGIQKQKLGEVQGALQIQELRKAAAEKAQTDALKAEYIGQLGQSNPQLARAIAIMPTEKFAEFIIQQNKPDGEDQTLKSLMTLGKLRVTNPALAKAYEAARFAPTMQGSLETGIFSVPRTIPAYTIDPDLLAEMQKRGL